MYEANKFVCPYCGSDHISVLATIHPEIFFDGDGNIYGNVDSYDLESEISATESKDLSGYCITCFGAFDVEKEKHGNKIVSFIPTRNGDKTNA